jgi:hypothetical protein
MNPGESAGGGERPPAAPMAAETAAPAREAAAPAREPAAPARLPEAPVASTGTDNKYVVWSSAPAETPRTGPDER